MSLEDGSSRDDPDGGGPRWSVVGPFGMFVWAACLSAGLAGLFVWGAERSARRADRSVRGLRVLGVEIGGQSALDTTVAVRAAVAKFLDEEDAIRFRGVGEGRGASRREVGLRVDQEALAARARAYGRDRDPLTDLVRRLRARRGQVDLLPEVMESWLDRAAARDFLVDLKDSVDRAAVDAHLDLDHHTIAREQGGT